MIIDNSLYEQADEDIKKLESQQGSSTYVRDERLLNCKGTRTIWFRMIPHIYLEKNEEGEEKVKMMTYLPYRVNTIKSVVNGKQIYAGTNPSCEGRPDFWKERQMELWDRKDLARAKLCYPTDKRLVNVFVIKDTGAEEGESQFRMWDTTAKPTDDERPKAGSPIMKELKKLAENEDMPVTNANIYSLGEDGITFKMVIIEPKSKNDFTSVEITSFPAGTTVQGFKGFPKDKLGEIYMKKTYNPKEFLQDAKSDDALWKIFNEHVMGTSTQSSSQNHEDLLGMGHSDIDLSGKPQTTENEDDQIPFDHPTTKTQEEPATDSKPKSASQELEDDIAKMLADIT